MTDARPSSRTDKEEQRSASPDFLVLVIDLNPFAWLKNSPSQDGAAAFEAIKTTLTTTMVFLNAHTSMNHGNGLAVYGATNGTAELLYTTATYTEAAKIQKETDVNVCLPFEQVDDAVFIGVRRMLETSCAKDRNANNTVGIVRALSLALCHINRMAETLQLGEHHGLASSTLDTNGPMRRNDGSNPGSDTFRFRIQILSVTPDASTQYVPMMNCIFCAQKMGIPIDVCHLFGEDPVFLRQASHLTGGHYYNLKSLDGLLQVLMTVYLPSRSIRPLLMFPAEDDVDYRAACFCHRRVIDIGYICSSRQRYNDEKVLSLLK
ncbi:RNA polymerase II transcription factor B subunit 4 [Malassezia cuniculi]|uniref:General transcription and DNA repair factor IIH subunit TFB4 n=1 Tax=Malassezia cuniculi TaxID=948313 RepID=A0AAF0EW35_9BASI|nr:RNA polymerase II transcription factor B subunit 4 [Malassezia cuniculi]